MNDLLKYYKYVKICKLCKKEYGLDSDTEKKLKDVCPNCRTKLRKK